MPARLHAALERRADALGLEGERRRAYVQGTLAKVEKADHPSHHHSPSPTGAALRDHMLGAHREPADDDRRRNETSEENRHYWLHYGATGRSDHEHRGRADG